MHFSNKYILDLIKNNVVLDVNVNDADAPASNRCDEMKMGATGEHRLSWSKGGNEIPTSNMANMAWS